MDFKTKSIFRDSFWYNPTFFLEISRVRCGLSRFVLPQQVFCDVVIRFAEKIEFLFNRYQHGLISLGTLFREKETIEKSIKSEISHYTEYVSCKRLGLDVIPYIYFINRILKNPKFFPDIFFFVSDRSGIGEIKRIERRAIEGKIDYQRGKSKIIKLEGKLLGYPRCCIREFLKGSAETRLILECVDGGLFKELINSLEKSEIKPFYAFFTSNFYPCSVDCRRAERIGEILDDYLDDYSIAFRLRTMVNVFYNLIVAYKTYKYDEKYKKILEDFFSKLDKKWFEVFEKSERSITNLTEFTNAFILRILRRI